MVAINQWLMVTRAMLDSVAERNTAAHFSSSSITTNGCPTNVNTSDGLSDTSFRSWSRLPSKLIQYSFKGRVSRLTKRMKLGISKPLDFNELSALQDSALSACSSE